MFLNRGMIEAAKTEGEVAGVMAHEISTWRSATARRRPPRARSSRSARLPARCSAPSSAAAAGSVISQGSQFGLGAYFLKYGREYETQADILGAQMMARAGYDPRHMANMFKTIEAQGGSGGPEWLSSHPNPGNRYNAINREAQIAAGQWQRRQRAEFQSIKARLGSASPAPTARTAQGQGSNGPVGTSGRTAVRVEPPSSQYRSYTPRSSCAWPCRRTGARSAATRVA